VNLFRGAVRGIALPQLRVPHDDPDKSTLRADQGQTYVTLTELALRQDSSARAYCRSRFLRMAHNLGIPFIAAHAPRAVSACCQNSMRLNSYLLKASIVGALGGLLFGFDTAVISGTLNSLRQVFESRRALRVTVAIALWGTLLVHSRRVVGQRLGGATLFG